jgi:TatD DNase family protein
MKYIDIHAHLNFSDFDEDREKVIERTLKNDMGVINIGTNLTTSKEVLDLAQKHEDLYCAIGIHPTEADKIKNIENSISELESMINNDKVVCVGECGLDFFHIDGDLRTHKDIQREIFQKQIDLALRYNLPLMIHCRDAYESVIEILKAHKKRVENLEDDLYGMNLRGNVHFFAGSTDDAREIIELGFTVSFTGVVTFAPQYRELIEFVPLDKMHAETDSPFVAPKPFRGKRNEPLYTMEVIKKIAEIKGLDFNTVANQLQKNATEMFGVAF